MTKKKRPCQWTGSSEGGSCRPLRGDLGTAGGGRKRKLSTKNLSHRFSSEKECQKPNSKTDYKVSGGGTPDP